MRAFEVSYSKEGWSGKRLAEYSKQRGMFSRVQYLAEKSGLGCSTYAPGERFEYNVFDRAHNAQYCFAQLR